MSLAFIISGIDKALAFEWLSTHLVRRLPNLYFILLQSGESSLSSFLKENKIQYHLVACGSKKDYPKAVYQTIRILRQYNTTHVHCHLQDACWVGLWAAFLCKVPHRIFTRHHGAQHHMYHPKGVWIDRMHNWLATKIVVPSDVCAEVLTQLDRCNPHKIHVVEHGFESAYFEHVSSVLVEQIQRKHRIPTHKKIITSIARATPLKGTQHVLSAFVEFLKKNQDWHLLLVGGVSEHDVQIQKLFHTLPKDAYTCISHEKELATIYALSSVLVAVSIQENAESFGQTYIEAILSGVPIIGTQSGIGKSVLQNGINGLVVGYSSADDILHAFERLALEASFIETLRMQILGQFPQMFDREGFKQRFSMETMTQKLIDVYGL